MLKPQLHDITCEPSQFRPERSGTTVAWFCKNKKNKNSLNPLVKLQVKRYELVLNSPVRYEKSVQRIVRTYYNKSIDCV
jgi:hypothetical protein